MYGKLNNKIVLLRTGSYLYGTNTKDSDQDYFGIFVPDKSYYYGFESEFKKYDIVDLSQISKSKDNKNLSDAVDYEYQSIRKVFGRLIKNSPNIIEMFFVNKSNIIYKHDLFDEIINNKDLFISKRIYYSFINFAQSQKHKMITKKENHEMLFEFENFFVNKDDNFQFLIEYVRQYDMPFIKEDQNNFTVGELKFPKNITFKNVNRQIKRRLKNITSRHDLILKYGYDIKFASHYLRLLFEAKMLLENGKIIFPLPMNEVMDVKLGKFKLNEVIDLSEQLEADCLRLFQTTNLQEVPDYDKINKLLIDITSGFLD